jgi:FAD/FMN-containing dehydrogenase
VTAVELVTANGEQVRADAANEPDLFWALRGGGGSFGAVTAIEFGLLEVPEIYAGMLAFPWERAGEVLEAWRGWLPSTPEELTSVGGDVAAVAGRADIGQGRCCSGMDRSRSPAVGRKRRHART